MLLKCEGLTIHKWLLDSGSHIAYLHSVRIHPEARDVSLTLQDILFFLTYALNGLKARGASCLGIIQVQGRPNFALVSTLIFFCLLPSFLHCFFLFLPSFQKNLHPPITVMMPISITVETLHLEKYSLFKNTVKVNNSSIILKEQLFFGYSSEKHFKGFKVVVLFIIT